MQFSELCLLAFELGDAVEMSISEVAKEKKNQDGRKSCENVQKVLKIALEEKIGGRGRPERNMAA